MNDAQNNFRTYPSPFVSPELKDQKEYGLKYAKALWAHHMNENSMYSSRIARYINNRRYAEGLQSSDKYKSLLGIEGDTSYMNLDYNPPPVLPKFIDILVNLLRAPGYKIICTPLDPASRTKIDEQLNEMKAKMFLKDVARNLEPTTGVPLYPKDKYVPENDEELDLYSQVDFKLDDAIAMEKAIQWVFDNNLSDEVEEKLVRDLVVCKIAALRCRFDQNFNLLREYVDVVDLIVPYSKKPNFSSIPHFGIKTYVSIQDLSQMAPEFSEEDLFKIARTAANQYGNGKWQWGENYSYYPAKSLYGDREYNNFLICLLDFEFLSNNTLKYAKTKKSGNTPVSVDNSYYFEEKQFDYQVPEGSKYKKSLVERRIKVKYAGMWVVGTDYLFNYGLAKNMLREKVNGAYSPDTELSIKINAPDIYDMENKSMCERGMPFADQIALCHLKVQQLVGSMKPPGLAIDVTGIQGVMKGMGDGAIKDKDIVQMYRQTGSFVYSGRDASGQRINNSVITELHSSVAGELESLVRMYEYNKNMIRDVLGINEVSDASTPDPKNLVGTSQFALQATNNAIRSTGNAYKYLVEASAKQTALMIQDSIQYNNRAFTDAIGQHSAEILDLGKNIPLCEFGIKVEFLPDNQEQAEMNNYLAAEIATGGLRSEDAIRIRQLMKTNVKVAAQMLILRKKKYAEERMAEKQADSQAQSQSAIEAANAKANADAQLIAIKIQGETEKEKAIMTLEMERDAKLHEYKMNEIRELNKGKIDTAKTTHDGKVLHTAFEKAIEPQETTGTSDLT